MTHLNYQTKRNSCEAEGMHSDITFYSKIKTSNGVFAEIDSIKIQMFWKLSAIPSLPLSFFNGMTSINTMQVFSAYKKYHHLDSHTVQ